MANISKQFMLKFFFFFFFFDVFVSAQTNTPTGRGNQLSSSSLTSLTSNAPILTSRPNSKPQYPPHSIQYSPNAEFVGGSVYSDGSGIHVHQQPYSRNPSYTDQSIVYQPGNFHSELQWADDDPYKYFGSYPSYEINYPSYEPNYPSFPINYPSYPTTNYPSYEPNYPSYEFSGVNTPTEFLDMGTGGFSEGGVFNLPGVKPQNMIPGTQYFPSNFLPRGMGLGRVIPVSDSYEPDLKAPMQPMQPMQDNGLGRVIAPTKDRTDALLMFTLGRALGQLDKNNNQSTASIVEKFLDITKPKVQSPPMHGHMFGMGTWDMWEQPMSQPMYGPILGMGPWEQPQSTTTWGQWDQWAQPEFVPPQVSPLQYPELQWKQPPISTWNQWGQPQWSQDISMSPWSQPNNIHNDNTFSNPWGQAYDPWWSLLFDKNEPKEKKEEQTPWWYELLKPKKNIDEED